MSAAGVPRLDTVVLVRHGTTDWSQAGRHTGWTELPLNGTGLTQATRLVAPLARWTFSTVLCSPLQRARATCTAAGYGAAAEFDPDLREWDYGDFDGMTGAEIRSVHPDWNVWDSGVPNGETIDQVAERADRVVTRLCALSGSVAVFAHGHLLRVLATRWVGQDPRLGRVLTLSTASISTLGWENDLPSITLWNDTDHLRRSP